MKNICQKTIALLSAMILGTMALPTAALAAAPTNDNSVTAQSEIQPRLTYIRAASATFFLSGKFSVSVTGVSEVNYIEVDVDLQEKGLFGYSTIETLSSSNSGSSLRYSDSFDLDESKKYRIKVTFHVYTASDSESTTQYAEAK